MATINTALQLSQIVSDVANISSSNTVDDMLMLSLAISETTSNIQVFVANTNALPNIVSSNVSDGQIYFVNDIKTLVVAGNKKWMGLDGRVLRCDGTPQVYREIWTFGENSFLPLLGDNSTLDKCSPVSISGNIINWLDVSSGAVHSLALDGNRRLWSWGGNEAGALGDGTTLAKSSPVSVVGGFTDWSKFCAGSIHNLAIRTNGTLWSWGRNLGGNIGDGTGSICKSSPVSVLGGFTDWCEVSGGLIHSTAIRTNGTLWAWGSNCGGSLGDGTTVSKCSPISVIGGFTDWCQVSAGYNHTVALRQNGTIWSWGFNTCGKLGDGTTVNKSSPVSVVGGFTDWCQVATGECHVLAIRNNGTLWSWGSNVSGRLGDGTTINRSSPVSVVGGFTDWCQVGGGDYHSIGIRTNGTVWTWGCNGSGELGNGTTTNRSSPGQIISCYNDWVKIGSGGSFNVLLRIT